MFYLEKEDEVSGDKVVLETEYYTRNFRQIQGRTFRWKRSKEMYVSGNFGKS